MNEAIRHADTSENGSERAVGDQFENQAAWLTSRRGQFAVRPASRRRPNSDEIVLMTRAISVNPLDRMIQTAGDMMFSWLKYPAVLGEDVAGIVVEIGSGVTRFAVGDRVIGHAVGTEKAYNDPTAGAFQRFVVLLDRLASPIPDTMTFEQAVVLPLSVSTASSGLFQPDGLALNLPQKDVVPTGKTVLVWGAATSVGSAAVQLAVNAGYDVVATCSLRNADAVLKLGARLVLDRNSPTIVTDLIAALHDDVLAGAIAVGQGSSSPTIEVVRAVRGNRVIALASAPIDMAGLGTGPKRFLRLLGATPALVSTMIGDQIKSRRGKVRTGFIWGSALKDSPVAEAVYRDFLPAALADGRFRPGSEALVVGSGLDSIGAAVEAFGHDGAPTKLVVSVPAEEPASRR